MLNKDDAISGVKVALKVCVSPELASSIDTWKTETDSPEFSDTCNAVVRGRFEITGGLFSITTVIVAVSTQIE